MSKKTYILRRFLTLLIFMGADLYLFSQSKYDLKNLRPDSVVVLGGNLISAPVRTSYGYAACGEGKIISGFTQDGTVLWQKGFSSRPKGIISCGIGDFLYIVTKDSVLSMLNPGGNIVWSRDLKYEILSSPLPGRDGRVFLRGKKYISCIGLNGKERWKLEVLDQDIKIPLLELNDGSLLLFLNKTVEGKSVARRIDPFGVISEEITFSGKVIKCLSTDYGVLLLFSDGTVGMCSIKEEKTYSRWLFNADVSPVESAFFISISEDSGAVIFSNPARAIVFNLKNGNHSPAINFNLVKSSEIKFASFTPFGISLCDKNNAQCISLDGTSVWECSLNPVKKWNYAFVTDSGYLALCTDNWVIEMYRMKQSLGVKSAYREKKCELYKELLDTERFLSSSELTGRAIPAELEDEMFMFFNGKKKTDERKIISVLDAELNSMYSAWNESSWDYRVEKPYFRKNISYNETIINLWAQSGISMETGKIARMIRTCNDDSLLLALINAAGNCGFDPNGELLDSLEYILKNKVSAKKTAIIDAIADSTYKLCAFMGKPAFYEQGKSILTYMLYPQFDEKNKSKARNVLNEIVKLKL